MTIASVEERNKMINKLLEQMRNLRIKNDYKNYRSLCNTLYEELRNQIFNKSKDRMSDEVKSNIKNIIKWVESEIRHIRELLEIALNDNQYDTFKVLSCINSDLIKILERLPEDINNDDKLYKNMYVDFSANAGQISKVYIYFEDGIYIIKNDNIVSNKHYSNIIKDFAKHYKAIVYIDTTGFGIGIYDELKNDDNIRVEALKYNRLV
jgi:hypothetical protein